MSAKPPADHLDGRAVQYLRMSSDHQQYSVANQMEAIASYASARGYEIVRSYTDLGRSGLTLEGRPAFRQLLADVQAGADFATILVLDVTRWGRFQSIDEGAFHEFTCKRHGVAVEYCGEPFRGDGSAIDHVLKAVKRGIASEYSRDLSNKVSQAQGRMAALGCKQGGPPPYGLRRIMQADGTSTQRVLARGERKFLKADRITLAPGPPDELHVLQFIFAAYVRFKLAPALIAALLQVRERVTGGGEPWSGHRIRHMLANRAYVGDLVYNRRSAKLGARSKPNSPSVWIVAAGAFAPIISAALFERAARLQDRYNTASPLVRHGFYRSSLAGASPALIAKITALLAMSAAEAAPILAQLELQTNGRRGIVKVARSSGQAPGWRCAIRLGKTGQSNFFADAAFRSSAQARNAASAWGAAVHALLTARARLVRKVSGRTTSRSGITGVVKVPAGANNQERWLACWLDWHGRRVTRAFSVAKHGQVEAKRLACCARAAAMDANATRLAEIERELGSSGGEAFVHDEADALDDVRPRAVAARCGTD